MNYIQLFIRKFKKNKLFTLLNLFGLTIGLSAFIYMNSYIHFERSFENFNPSADRVYRVTSQKTQNNEIQERKSCAPVILKEHLLATHGEIEKAARVHIIDAKRLIIRINGDNGDFETYVENIGHHAEKDFFELFGTSLIEGNSETALDGPNKVVLTKSTAAKYFGEDNPIGKSIIITDDFEMEYEVTGVVNDVPANSHFQYNLLISFDTFVKQRPHWRWEAWDWDYFHTYIRVNKNVNPVDLEQGINSSIAIAASDAYKERGYTMSFELQNIVDIHLNSNLGRELNTNGNGDFLIYLEIIAYFILILA
ncbi:MAG: ABC transporter permease, partial [Fulvivirga sp.]|uniref:ABC transporter permease n=1 Tax=Fulvivirga sp. TaxID=1931237 RepID=UPI0032EEF929